LAVNPQWHRHPLAAWLPSAGFRFYRTNAGVRYVLDVGNTLKLDGVSCGDPPALKSAVRPMRIGGILAEFFKLFCCCHYR
jgi:hypothetical protein